MKSKVTESKVCTVGEDKRKVEWQPIETAPSNTSLLICVFNTTYHTPRKQVICAEFVPKYSREECCDYLGDTDYSSELDTYYWPEGWYESNEYGEDQYLINDTVIGWMLLPEPVEQGGAE